MQETFRQIAQPADFVGAWAKFLHDGVLAESAQKTEPLTFNGEAARALISEGLPLAAFDANTFEVVLVADSKLDDGRHANNGWLQEFPDPITKLTWDNAALVSPATAKKLDVETGDFIEVSFENRRLEIPVLIAPGHADQSLTIPLGYGRTHAGRIGSVGQTTEGHLFDTDMRSGGFNAYVLSTTRAPYIIVGAQVKTLGTQLTSSRSPRSTAASKGAARTCCAKAPSRSIARIRDSRRRWARTATPSGRRRTGKRRRSSPARSIQIRRSKTFINGE